MRAKSWMRIAFLALTLSASTWAPATRDQYHLSKLDPEVRKNIEAFQNRFYNLKEGDFVVILEESGLNHPGLYRVITSNGSSITLIGPASYSSHLRNTFTMFRTQPWIEVCYMKKFDIVTQNETAGRVFTHQWNLLD